MLKIISRKTDEEWETFLVRRHRYDRCISVGLIIFLGVLTGSALTFPKHLTTAGLIEDIVGAIVVGLFPKHMFSNITSAEPAFKRSDRMGWILLISGFVLQALGQFF